MGIIQEHILNENVVPQLTKELNAYLTETITDSTQQKKQVRSRLAELERKKANILDAIAKTGYDDLFIETLNQITTEAASLVPMLQKLEGMELRPQVTEDMVREYFRRFQTCIVEHNIPQMRMFIRSYVKRVEIYPDTVKVFFQVALTTDEGFPVNTRYEFEAAEKRQLLKLA